MLLHRRFAAVPCAGAGPALESLRALRPDVIVADAQEAATLRDRVRPGRSGGAIPVVEFAGLAQSVDLVVRQIRHALRVSQPKIAMDDAE
jgi:hypothetical protein